MSTRIGTIAQVAESVLSSDTGFKLPSDHVHATLNIALRTVIGLNCLGGGTLDIDLGNGHFLHCSLKRAISPTSV